MATGFAGAAPVAGKVVIAGTDILSDNDIGLAGDMTTPGRWGEPEDEDGRSFRAYPGSRSLSYVGIKPWFKGDGPGEDVIIAVTFKDTTPQPVSVHTWHGTGRTYGYDAVGWIGGADDGKWKRALMVCPKGLVRIRPGQKPENVCWMLFTGGGKIALDRIQVIRASEPLMRRAVADARAARAASIESIKKTFRHVPRKKKEPPLGEVPARWKELGFIPYVRSYMIDVYPDSVPAPAERGLRPLRAYATPGEFEPIQVAAYALKDVTLAAWITDLKGPGVIKADRDIKIHRIESVPMRVGSSWGKQWRIMPVWMRPNRALKVKAGASQAWYVSVRVPADARAGLYKGTFGLGWLSAQRVSFPVEFRVLPFRLDKADAVARGPYVASIIGDEYIRDLAEHGMNSSSIFSRSGFAPKLAGGKCVADISERMNRYLRKLKQAGFVRVVHFGGGDPAYNNPAGVPAATGTKVGTPEFAKYYGQFWQDIRRQEKENGWPEIICCPFDEPVKSAAKTRNYLTCYEVVKQASPATKVFCVFMNRRGAAGRLGRRADIWSCNGAFDVARAEKKRLADHGIDKLFYTYTGAMGSTRPGDARYNAGVLPWHYDADGTYFWAYLWSNGDPFNDLDAGARDWSPVARDVDGKVYGSIGWEGYREGVDDQRYIHTCMRMAKEKGRKDVLAKIDRLKKDVKKGKESDESRRTRGLDDFFIKVDGANFLDVYRAELAAMILEMLGAAE